MNKKWYRSAFVKGVLVVLAVVSLAGAALGGSWIAFGVGPQYLNPMNRVEDRYEKSYEFMGQMDNAVRNLGEGIRAEKVLIKDGKLNEERIVDIEKFNQSEKITGKNESGFAYQIKDLLKENDTDSEKQEYERQVVVCRKIDGGYHYEFWDEFRAKMLSGELTFAELLMKSSGEEEKEELLELYLDNLETNYEVGGNGGYFGVCDKEGKLIYSDCWQLPDYYGMRQFLESKPLDAENVLQLVNENPEWNGRLSEMRGMYENARNDISSMERSYRRYKDAWKEGQTNLTYLLMDDKKQKVYTNNPYFKDYEVASKEYEKLKVNLSGSKNAYIYLYEGAGNSKLEVESMLYEEDADHWDWISYEIKENVGIENFRLVMSLDLSYPVQDSFKENAEAYGKIAPYVHDVAVDSWICVAVFIIAIIWLTVVAGRSNTQEEVKTNIIDRLFTEIPFCAIFCGGFILIGGIFMMENYSSWYWDNGGYYYYSRYITYVDLGEICAAAAVMLAGSAMFFYGYLSCVRKLKVGTFFKQIGTFRICKWAWKWTKIIFHKVSVMVKTFWSNRDLLTRTILICVAFVIIQILGMVSVFFVFAALAMDALLFVFLMKHTLDKKKVKDGIKEIASGNIEYKIPLEGLRDSNKEMAESINTIGDGLGAAVEQSLKSERLKTDLITNVSHDIKTPLTSIINYVDLLKRENIENPKVQGYIKVLEEKAQRLKTLTEDVVEASKISSGNISLEMMDLNLVEMLHQTSGEFAEKFEKRGLKLVENLPETPVMIHADGRRMWRVLANIYNNAAKYAMENTRVYADLVQNDREVIFSLKNMSEQQLNINAEELTERFIRGDVSRSTEGSGLGLSIAKNLTERQGGEFKLYLDGDLFKVMIVFPKVK